MGELHEPVAAYGMRMKSIGTEASEADRRVADGYWMGLRNLKPEIMLDLMGRMFSVMTYRRNAAVKPATLSAVWEDDRSVEEIMSQLRGS